jgi:hypothetical protein
LRGKTWVRCSMGLKCGLLSKKKKKIKLPVDLFENTMLGNIFAGYGI